MIQQELNTLFQDGEKLTIKEVNKRLQTLYNKHKIKKIARSTDLLLLGFQTRRTTINVDGRKAEALKINVIGSNKS